MNSYVKNFFKKMIKLHNPAYGYSIEIPDEAIIYLGLDFFSFEVPFMWHHHAMKCKDCKCFLRDLLPNHKDKKPIYEWVISYENNFFHLKPSLFKLRHELSYCDNFYREINSHKRYVTEVKLCVDKIDENKKDEYIKHENYGACCIIRDYPEVFISSKTPPHTQ